MLHRDPYQFPFDAWDIKQDYFTSDTAHAPGDPRRELATTAPTVTRRQLYRYRSFAVEQRVILEAGSDVVRFETLVDWHATHRMLRADFFPTHYGDTVRCEIQFGHIERVTTENDAVETAQFEICAHKWIATQDDAGGFALLNDSQVRAPGQERPDQPEPAAFADLPRQDGRPRSCTDSPTPSRPFAPDDLAKVVREGYRLNNPLLIADGAALESVASVDDPGVIIETIKPAENGRGRGRAALREPGPSDDHRAPNHVGTDVARSSPICSRTRSAAPTSTRLEFGPFEIVTLLLEDPALEG